MFHVTAVQGFGVPAGAAASKPASLFDLAAELVARAEQRPRAGLGALVSDYDALIAASRANKKAGYVDPTGAVYCSVPDRSGSFRLECRANAPKGAAAREPAKNLQRAADAFLALVPLYGLTGQALDVKLADGTTEPGRVIPKFPEKPIEAIGGGYDGIIGTGTMEFAVMALLIAAALSLPPPTVIPAFASPTQLTFALAAADIAAFLDSVAANFPALLAAYKERGKPAADVLVPETVVVPPAPKAAASKSNVGLLIGLAAVGLAITVGGSYAAARAWRQEHAADADLSPAYGLGRRRYRAYRGGAAW